MFAKGTGFDDITFKVPGFTQTVSCVDGFNLTGSSTGPVSFDLVCDGSQWQIPPSHTCYAMTD